MYSLLPFLSWRFYCKLFTVNYIICCSKCHLTSGGITCWNWVSIGLWFCLSSWTINERFVLLSLLCPSSTSAFWTTQQLSAAVFFLHNNTAVTTRTRFGERGFSATVAQPPGTPFRPARHHWHWYIQKMTQECTSWSCLPLTAVGAAGRVVQRHPTNFTSIDWTLYNCSQC